MDIFDLIGPIMVGPSSSHTAGAVRIGYVARKIFREEPKKAEIILHGSFAATGLGHGTDSGNRTEKFQTQLLGFCLCFCRLHGSLKDQTDLLIQIIHHILDEHGKIVTGVVDSVGLFLGIAGIDDPHELADHINDDLLIRIALGGQFVDSPAMTVILQNAVNNAFNFQFNGVHGNPSFICHTV